MVYAMMSIGVLGFIVWSQWMAFLIYEFKVINFTVGWEGLKNLKLLSTFYSSNGNNIAQSAGNHNVGSSETIRENTYDIFLENYNQYFNNNKFIDCNWLNWFVGFSEGDGAILEYNGRSRFVLTQKDVVVLEKIKSVLNFGHIRYTMNQNGYVKYGRFIVSDNNDILLLYLLFNGNLRINYRKEQLKRWEVALKNAVKLDFSKFNIDYIPDIIEDSIPLSLSDSWLSGFTDAEGCFSVRMYKHRDVEYVKIVFILDQKGGESLLNEISLLLCDKKLSKLRKTVNGNMYRIEISCNDINKQIYGKITDYFNAYKLKTTKHKSYTLWKDIALIVRGNQPLCDEKIKKIRGLRHSMNRFIIENNPIGIAKKS